MREIKFRAWQSKDNVMLTWEKLQHIKQFALDDLMNKDSVIVLPVNKEITLMQYTGLKDKNGVEIYEGDIIRIHTEYWKGVDCFEIKYEAPVLRFVNNKTNGIITDNESVFEVIGNIYENKDLLN